MKSAIIFLSFATICYALLGIGNLQSVAVKGRLVCKGKPANNVKLKLYDVEAVLDRLLDERFSNADGEFELSGSATEVTRIDPKLNIYHTCNYDGLCYKKVAIEIPGNYISDGDTAEKVFDIGELNLAGQFSGESTDCIN